MEIRTTRTTVTIEQPFSLRGCDQILAPGSYEVDTDEKRLDGLSFLAHQRIDTFIHLHKTQGRPGVGRFLSVSGEDLDTAIARGRVARDLGLNHQLADDRSSGPDTAASDRADEDGMA